MGRLGCPTSTLASELNLIFQAFNNSNQIWCTSHQCQPNPIQQSKNKPTNYDIIQVLTSRDLEQARTKTNPYHIPTLPTWIFHPKKSFPAANREARYSFQTCDSNPCPTLDCKIHHQKKKKKESRKTLLCFLSFELWQWSLDGWMRCFLVVYCLCDVENFHERFEVDTSLDRIREHISL